MKTAVVTARLTPETLAELDRLAEHHERSRAWLVADAVKRYVAEESELLAFVRAGEGDFARGDYLTHDELIGEMRAAKQKAAA